MPRTSPRRLKHPERDEKPHEDRRHPDRLFPPSARRNAGRNRSGPSTEVKKSAARHPIAHTLAKGVSP